MDKYLLEILKEVNTIIIPGMGALTITNPDKNEFMFMPYLKHDDGQLSGYISEKEGIDENESKNIISKYVREIQASLDKGESYDMYQFGSFVKTDDEIEFIGWTDSEKKESISVAPVKSTTEEDKTEEIKVEKTTIKEEKEEKPEPKIIEEKVVSTPTPPVIEKPVDKIEEKPKPATKEEIKPIKTSKTEEEKVVKPVPVTPPSEGKPLESKREFNIAEKEEQEKTKAKLEGLKKQKEEAKKKKKRPVGRYVLLLFLFLIIAAGGYIIYDFDNMKNHLPFLASEEQVTTEKPQKGNKSDKKEDSTEKTESIQENPQPVEDIPSEPVEAKTKPVIEEKPQPIVSNDYHNKYHILAGAFSSKSNAERFLASLNSNLNGKVVEEGGYYKVSLGTFITKDEAKAAISTLSYDGNARVSYVD